MVSRYDPGEILKSFGYDSNTSDCLTMDEVDSTFKQVLGNRKLDVCAFNCCLMNEIEVACTLSKYVDHMVACQTLLYAIGFSFSHFLSAIGPTTSSEQLATAIFDSAAVKRQWFLDGVDRWVKLAIADNDMGRASLLLAIKFSLAPNGSPYQVGLLDLRKMERLTSACAFLVSLMLAKPQFGVAALQEIVPTLFLNGPQIPVNDEQMCVQNVDMNQLCQKLTAYFASRAPVLAQAGKNVEVAIRKIVTKSWTHSGKDEGLRIGVFLPRSKALYDKVKVLYTNSWTRATKWNQLVEAFLESTP